VLSSSSLFFAIERGNCDLMVVPFLMGAAWALRKKSPGRDVCVGVCLALATGIKVYPGLTGLAVLALRRWRAAGWCLAAGPCAALVDSPHAPAFLDTLSAPPPKHSPAYHGVIYPTIHTLSGCWAPLWQGTRLDVLSRIPGTVAALGLLVPLCLWVSWHVARCP